MTSVTDFLHDEAVVDAVCDELKDHLPASWTSAVGKGGYKAFALKRLEFGDMRDYRMEPEETWYTNCPMVLVKPISNSWNRERSGIGGKQAIDYSLRVVHLWHWDQCLGTSTNRRTSPAHSKTQRLKVLNKAVFAAADRKLGNPTLTCADSGVNADVHVVHYNGSYLEGIEDVDILPDRYYAVATDLTVITTTA